MRLLLDTNVVIWRFSGTRALGPRASEALARADVVSVSAITFVEIGIKVGTGKLVAPGDIEARIAQDGMRVLAVRPAHGFALATLPLHHRDPFDRLLVAQAQREELTIVTTDRAFAAYDVRTLDPLS